MSIIISRSLCLMCLLMLSFALVSAQSPSPTPNASEKEKAQKELEKQVLKILDDAVNEAGNLKLANNRAIVYAIAGDLYWKFDEKRARELFRNAGGEIINANAEFEKEKKETDDRYLQFFDSSGVRNDVLPMIAKHDADLALELLVQTRPAKITEALAKAALPNAKQDGNGYFNFDIDQLRVQREIALEQSFAVFAAEQNPDKAIKLFKDSLAKGISWNVYPLLQKINKKDEKKAGSLADDVIKKIVDTDLTKRKEDLNAAIQFLQLATNPNAPKNTKEKQFKFSDAQLKDLADKLVNTLYAAVKFAGNNDGDESGDGEFGKNRAGKSSASQTETSRSDEEFAAGIKKIPTAAKNVESEFHTRRDSCRIA